MLTNCTHDTHTADCGHNEDASVRCDGIRKLPFIIYYGHISVHISTYNHIMCVCVYIIYIMTTTEIYFLSLYGVQYMTT